MRDLHGDDDADFPCEQGAGRQTSQNQNDGDGHHGCGFIGAGDDTNDGIETIPNFV